MLLNQLLNNLPSCLKAFLKCICAHVNIKVNVFIQKNAYDIHNYVHKYMKNSLFREKYSFSSYVLSRILLSFMEKFTTGVADKKLTYKTHANSNFNGDQSTFLAN